jgi:hypothetical protein
MVIREWTPRERRDEGADVMTYAVVSTQGEREKILGMIWAEGKSQAQAIATNLYPSVAESLIHLRETESRELPLRLATQPLVVT